MSRGGSNRERVRIFEVGPRDGIQNESRTVTFAQKTRLIRDLVAAGVRDLELGAFVRPDRVPQMADTDRIYGLVRRGTLKLKPARAWALVPNRRGLERALAAENHQIAVFTAATDSFARRNIGMSIRESLAEFKALIREGKAQVPTLHVRGYVSTAFGCPFEGRVAPRQALRVIDALRAAGADEISVGDTIGVADPRSVKAVFVPAIRAHGAGLLAAHLHDTRGTALANALQALELGIRSLDSSVGGLGGCPFAPGAAGNLATEDLLYMLHGMGFRTGIDLEALCRASLRFSRAIGRPITSRYLQAFLAGPWPAPARRRR